MVSILDLINPIYFLPIGAFFIIVVGCACYGCYDLVSLNFINFLHHSWKASNAKLYEHDSFTPTRIMPIPSLEAL